MTDDGTMSRKSKIAIAVAAAVLVATPIATNFEGFSGEVYLDPAHIPTQGYGETENTDPTRIWSKDEAMARLRQRLAKDYAPQLIQCVPSFVDHTNAYGAALDAAYNAGPAAFCRSPMAKAFNHGDYKTGCKAFLGWYVTALDRRTGLRKRLPGLLARRTYESKVCMKDAA